MKEIKKRFEDFASSEVLDDLLQKSYPEALKESKLSPISRPSIVDVNDDFGEGKPLTYSAEFEVQPVIELQNYSGYSLKKIDVDVKEKEVDEMLEYLRTQHSSMETVERPAELDDFIFADLEILEESSGQMKEKEFKGVQLEMKEEGLQADFTKALVGTSAGDQKEIEVNYPEDHFDKRFAGHKFKYRANVESVKKMNLIPLDDSFFSQIDESLTSLDDLKDRLRDDIVGRKEKESTDLLREEIIKETIDKNSFDLPDSMVEEYLDSIVADFRNKYKDDFDEKEVREKYRTHGKRQIRWSLLLHEIAKKEDIKPEQEDIDAVLQKFADNYGMTLEEAKKRISDSRQIQDIRETILEDKVIDFITKNSEIETVDIPDRNPAQEV